MSDRIEWKWAAFNALTLDELYGLMVARQRVFVVEQTCPFLDADGLDPVSWHLLGSALDSGHGVGVLAACLRVLPPGARYVEPSIGRVLTVPEARGKGIGRVLMEEGIRRVRETYPGQGIRIAAQQYLESFYGSLGFRTVSAPFDEDGIQHVEMLRDGES